MAALLASNFLAAGAQQNLRERALKEGHVHAGAIVDYVGGCCADLADLVKRSETIVRGKVTDSNGGSWVRHPVGGWQTRISGRAGERAASSCPHDEKEVWTDYTISIPELYKQGEGSSFAPGAKILATKLGGQLLVYGPTPQWHPPEPLPAHLVEHDVGPSPVSQGIPEIF